MVWSKSVSNWVNCNIRRFREPNSTSYSMLSGFLMMTFQLSLKRQKHMKDFQKMPLTSKKLPNLDHLPRKTNGSTGLRTSRNAFLHFLVRRACHCPVLLDLKPIIRSLGRNPGVVIQNTAFRMHHCRAQSSKLIQQRSM